MNVFLSTIGRRGYIADYFKNNLKSSDKVFGSSDRHSVNLELTPGFMNCDQCFIVPSIKDDEYVNTLLHICKTNNVNVLVPLYDYDSYILSFEQDAFKQCGILPIISSQRVNKIAFDKYETYCFLVANGFDSPKTALSLAEFEQMEMSFPVIVKPRFGFGSEGVFQAKNEHELKFFMNYLGKENIIQEKLEGDEFGFDIFNDLNNRVISIVLKRKIIMRSGETDQAITVKNDDLLMMGERIGSLLQHTGPLDVDFFVVDNKPFIIDINPRFGGGYPLTYLAGVDFTKYIIDMANGKELIPKIGEYAHNVVMIKNIVPQKVELL